MLRLLDRNIVNLDRRLVLIAPPAADTAMFHNVTKDSTRYAELVGEMQRLRGAVYLHEGNVRAGELSADGRHQTPEDDRGWHLLMLDDRGQVSSCIWYLEHENATSMHQLRLRHSPLARHDAWCDVLKKAVESEIRRAEAARLRYAEVGGWVVARTRRYTCEGLILALAAFGLCRLLGGALGVTTANLTHASSAILRRLGGSHLEHAGVVLPPYYDPKYNAHVELLRFDSRRPSGKYVDLIKRVTESLRHVPLIGLEDEPHSAEWHLRGAAQSQLAF